MYSLWKERPNQKESTMSDNLRRYRAIRDALIGYPFNAGHFVASIIYRESLMALPGHGQLMHLR